MVSGNFVRIKPKQFYLKRVKIDRFLSREGICSRSESEKFGSQGSIKINGTVVHDVTKRFDPTEDIIELLKGSTQNSLSDVLIIMNKPKGFISQVMTSKLKPANTLLRQENYASYINGKPAILNDVIKQRSKFYPLLTLEKEASGILALSNSKEWLRKVCNYEVVVNRTFEISLSGPLIKKDLMQMYKGVNIQGNFVKPKKMELLDSQLLIMNLETSYKNQIYSLVSKCGVKPKNIKCLKYEKMELGTLKPGQWFIVDDLKKATSKSWS
ncbi:MAG: hypothetical protein COA79_03870 [Planctomycetota bacterium]|nr:MAG: hypothetical protein COA79_03870 [Planctomycetota bacterium]